MEQISVAINQIKLGPSSQLPVLKTLHRVELLATGFENNEVECMLDEITIESNLSEWTA